MRSLREELERQKEATQKANAKAAEDLKKFEEASKTAESMLAELRKKMLTMQSHLRAKGLGEEADECAKSAGLTDFLATNVFERLYRDALDRMRRLAELQAKIFAKQSEDFLRSIGECMSPHIKLPGLDRNDIYQDFGAPTSGSLRAVYPWELSGDHGKHRVPVCERSASKP